MATKTPHRGWEVRFPFAEEPNSLSTEQSAQQWLQEAARLFCSESPALRVAGAKRLAIASKLLATLEERRFNSTVDAGLDRPNAKKPLKAKVEELMKGYAGTKFKDFLASWERETLEGLRLTRKADGFAVEDENSIDEKASPYTLGTLTTMFSNARSRTVKR